MFDPWRGRSLGEGNGNPLHLILPSGGNHVVFLELRRHSRVTTGISAFPLGWPWRRGSQGASRAAPGKSGLHARGEGAMDRGPWWATVPGIEIEVT